MNVEKIPVGARLVDSEPFSRGGTAAQAKRLRETGIDGLVGYLGTMNTTRLRYVLDAGLGFMPVTYAGEYFDGAADELKHLRDLGLPAGLTVMLDLEGKKSYGWPPQDLIAKIDAWALAIQKAGYIAGLYIGSPQPLTGEELARLRVTRYWCAPSLVLDRNGRSWAEPPGLGFCMRQMWPQRHWPNDTDPDRVWVDVNMVGEDRRARVPTWIKA